MVWQNEDDEQISLPDPEQDVEGYRDFDWTTEDIQNDLARMEEELSDSDMKDDQNQYDEDIELNLDESHDHTAEDRAGLLGHKRTEDIKISKQTYLEYKERMKRLWPKQNFIQMQKMKLKKSKTH